MYLLRNSLLILALAGACLAQTVASVDMPEGVRRVGHHLACKCGCSDTVATCQMLECGFSHPARARIQKMQTAGMSDEAVIKQFIADYGQDIYRGEPSPFGWVVPYAGLFAGLGLIALILKRYMKARPVAEPGPVIDDPALAKYREQIEKDLAQLD